MDEGDDTHLCFAFGALQGVYLVDSLYARGPTTPTELSPVIALLLVVFGRGELSAFTSSPTGVPSVVSYDAFIGFRYMTRKGCQKLERVKLVSRPALSGPAFELVLCQRVIRPKVGCLPRRFIT